MTSIESAAVRHRPFRGLVGTEPRPGTGASSLWKGAATAVWQVLAAVGHRRAEQQIAVLLKQWGVTNPELAGRLREALRRGD